MTCLIALVHSAQLKYHNCLTFKALWQALSGRHTPADWHTLKDWDIQVHWQSMTDIPILNEQSLLTLPVWITYPNRLTFQSSLTCSHWLTYPDWLAYLQWYTITADIPELLIYKCSDWLSCMSKIALFYINRCYFLKHSFMWYHKIKCFEIYISH